MMANYSKKFLAFFACVAASSSALQSDPLDGHYRAFLELTEQDVFFTSSAICAPGALDKARVDIANAFIAAFNEEFANDPSGHRMVASATVGLDNTDYCAGPNRNRSLRGHRMLPRNGQSGNNGSGSCTNCPPIDPPPCDDTHNNPSCNRRRRLDATRLARISASQQLKLAGEPYTVGDLSFVHPSAAMRLQVTAANTNVTVDYLEKTIESKEQELEQIKTTSIFTKKKTHSLPTFNDGFRRTMVGIVDAQALENEIKDDSKDLTKAESDSEKVNDEALAVILNPGITPEEKSELQTARTVLQAAVEDAKSRNTGLLN